MKCIGVNVRDTILKIAAIFCTIHSWCFAHTFIIRGIVQDISGKNLSGAHVQLLHTNLHDTSGIDGRFEMSGTMSKTVNIKTAPSDANKILSIPNSMPNFSNSHKSIILGIFNINGRKIFSNQSNTAIQNLQLSKLTRGVCIFRIENESIQYSFTGTILNKSLIQPGLVHRSKSSDELQPEQPITSPIEDTLLVTKTGFLNYRRLAKTIATSEINIHLISNTGNVTDIDGNIYHSVQIGNQVWTVENLRATRYNDGTPIMYVPDSATWLNIYLSGATTDAYCIYGCNTAGTAKYGLFYNWYAVNTGKLAPHGWRVPTDTDWDILEKYLASAGYSCDDITNSNLIAKSMAAQWDWDSSTIEGAIGNNLTMNNSSGFSAIPGGLRHWGGSFYSSFLGKTVTYLWSSTEFDSTRAWHRHLDSHKGYVDRLFHHKNTGFPVRIVRDVQ